jgi:hypothetical protein
MRSASLATAAAMTGILVAGSALLGRGGAGGTQDRAGDARPIALPPGRISLQLVLGIDDREPTDWSGSIELSAGTVESLESLDRAEPLEVGRWQLRSQAIPAKAKAKAKKKADAGPPRIAPVRLVATLDAPRNTMVSVETPRGRASFALSDIGYGVQSRFLGGAIGIERVPQTRRITSTQDVDNDFAACASGPDGTTWLAYVAYKHGPPIDSIATARGDFESLTPRGHGDQVRLMKFERNTFSAPDDVTTPGLDVWRPAVAVDREGGVWAIWSQQLAENWDLYARRYDPKAATWGAIQRLTSDPGADLNVVAASGREEGVWIAWQGWRDGNFDIWLAKLDAGRALEPKRVSTSPRNDWNPAIVLDGRGTGWVGFDSYEQGNYDVFVRRFRGDQLEEPIAIAASPRFEARPSLALDGEGRLWVAFEDAGANWGKDHGSRFPGKQGIPFYLERNILVRCIEGGQVREPRVQPRSELIDTHYDDLRIPKTKHHRISFPRLASDGRGALWLLYRRHPLLSGDLERWISFATRLEGDRWSREFPLRNSDNTLDNRPALAAESDGGLLVLYSSDGRTAGSPSAKVNDLYAARLELDGPVAHPALAAAAVNGTGPNPAPIHPNEPAEIEGIRVYRVQAGGKTYQLLRGEFHRHSEISAHRDWDGPLEEIWRYALDVAAMDWIGPGDHDYGMGKEYLWWLAQKQIDLYDHPPRFLPMFTYERSVPYPSGHRNVMFAHRGIRPLPQMEGKVALFGTPESGSPDVKNLYAYLKHFSGLCSSHTSATSMGTDWRDNDPDVEPVVEIIQGHRQNYEEPSAPQAAHTADESIQGFEPAGFVWQAFAKGRRLGFQSSSDHVSTHISYAVVLAEEPTREGILAAFKKRHSYAAQDNIILDVQSGGHVMGDEFTSKEAPTIDLTAIGTAPISRIDIVRQVGNELPRYAYNFAPNKRAVKLHWTDESAKGGAVNMYYVRIEQEDKKLAWSSPIWVTYQR